MSKMTIPNTGNNTLFEVTLEPVIKGSDRLVKGRSTSSVDINMFRNKKNKVAVGVPYCENYISRLIAEDKEIPHDVLHLGRNFDFHFVSLSCSFIPDRGCKFIWARFCINLKTVPAAGEMLLEEPVAHDMFPSEILSQTQYQREINISPEIKLNLGEASVDTKWINIGTKKNLIIYEPQIYSFGIHTSSVGWDFRDTKGKGLWGDKKDLLLIVRAPKGAIIKGKFSFDAEVSFNIGKWIPIPLSKKEDDLIDTEYTLSS